MGGKRGLLWEHGVVFFCCGSVGKVVMLVVDLEAGGSVEPSDFYPRIGGYRRVFGPIRDSARVKIGC